MFSQVSQKLHLDNPKTLPHMQRIIDRLDMDKRHVQLDRVIDFKEYLKSHTDKTVADLKDSHQIRIAMRPKNPPSNWVDGEFPVLQGKLFADDKCSYLPEMGVMVLLSVPQAPTERPRLSELRPLYCISQAFEEVDVDPKRTLADNTLAATAPASKKVILAMQDMDCTPFKENLKKLRAGIDYLKENNFFYCTRFADETEAAMYEWWNLFLDDQEDIMDSPHRRMPAPLATHDRLLQVFTEVIVYALESDRRRLFEEESQAAKDMQASIHRTSQYNMRNLLQNFRAPSTTTQQIAEHDSFEPLLRDLIRSGPGGPSAKLCLAISPDRVGADDIFAGYVGPGSKQRSRPRLWVWMCEVQEVLSHSEDWQEAEVRVHWYRPYPKCSRRWIAAFWEKGGTLENNRTMLDLPENVDPNDEEYWYQEVLTVHFSTVVSSFDGFIQKSVKDTDENGREKKDADGKVKKTKGDYVPEHILRHCQERCLWLDSVHRGQRGLEEPGAHSTPGTPTLQTTAVPNAGPSGRDRPQQVQVATEMHVAHPAAAQTRSVTAVFVENTKKRKATQKKASKETRAEQRARFL